MKTREQELHELAAAIEENEGCESIAALAKARQMLAELQRAAHQVIERLIKRACAQEPQLWDETLARGERVVDQTQKER